MTTLRDILNDFAEDIKRGIENDMFGESWEDVKEEAMDEAIINIKERIIG